ncbi:MAG: histidine kinase, partial [Nitrosopumilaceae archaeon]
MPERLTSIINYKVLLLILGLVAGFQLYLYSLPDPEEADTTISVISTLNPLTAAVVGFFVAKRYQGSKVFGKSYFALALGLSMMVLGEITYGIQDLLGIDPYPSVADVFFIS